MLTLEDKQSVTVTRCDGTRSSWNKSNKDTNTILSIHRGFWFVNHIALARKMPQATMPIVTPTNSNPISAIKHRRAHFNSTLRRLSMIFCRSAVVFSGNQAGNPASSDGGGRRGEIRNIAPRIQKGGKTTKRLVYRPEISREDLRNPNLKRYIASVMGSVSRQVYSGGST